MSNIQDKIQEELENARAVCSTEGATSGECAAAWDAVEELQAEAAHQRQDHPQKTFKLWPILAPAPEDSKMVTV